MTSKKCKHCGSTLKHEGLTFCNSSCAATYNNKRRRPRSEESRKKTSDSLAGKPSYRKGMILFDGQYIYACHISFCSICGKYVPNNGVCCEHAKGTKAKQTRNRVVKMCCVSFCKVCGKCIPNEYRKTCSKECYSKNQAKNMSERLSKLENREKYNRGRKSYMEQSFEKWLLENNSPEFIMEKSFRNHDLKKTYFSDFYFPSLNLIIELDGTQHRNTVNADAIRDAYFKSYYNIEVFRISHKEYQAGSKIEQVKQMLGI